MIDSGDTHDWNPAQYITQTLDRNQLDYLFITNADQDHRWISQGPCWSGGEARSEPLKENSAGRAFLLGAYFKCFLERRYDHAVRASVVDYRAATGPVGYICVCDVPAGPPRIIVRSKDLSC
jgi:hypothetical protein